MALVNALAGMTWVTPQSLVHLTCFTWFSSLNAPRVVPTCVADYVGQDSRKFKLNVGANIFTAELYAISRLVRR